jgi:hypothetical protein
MNRGLGGRSSDDLAVLVEFDFAAGKDARVFPISPRPVISINFLTGE